MYCDRRGPENRGVSVCVSVCVSVDSRLPKLLGRFQPIPKWVPKWSSCARLWFSSLAYLMTSRRPCLRVSERALSRPQFWSDFLEIENLSKLSYSIVCYFISVFYVINFWSKWPLKKPLKTQVTYTLKQKTYSYRSWPADHEYVHGLLFWPLFPLKITVKS